MEHAQNLRNQRCATSGQDTEPLPVDYDDEPIIVSIALVEHSHEQSEVKVEPAGESEGASHLELCMIHGIYSFGVGMKLIDVPCIITTLLR